MPFENWEMDEGHEDRAEEYYNCGYDGIYEPKEKAIIFNCVGRGLKLPPLSEINFPSVVVKGYDSHVEKVKPSCHVLELMSRSVASSQDSDLNEKIENYQSSHEYLLHMTSDKLSESSSQPVLSTVPLQPQVNEICSSISVNGDVLSEGCDSVGAEDTACNLNSGVAANVENLVLDKQRSLGGELLEAFHTTCTTTKHKVSDKKSIWKPYSDSFQITSVTTKCSDIRNASKLPWESSQITSNTRKHKVHGCKSAWKPLWDSDHQNTWTGESESYLLNSQGSCASKIIRDSVEDVFFTGHFTSFKNNASLPLHSLAEFPRLPMSQTQNPLKQSEARTFSVKQLKIRSESLPPRSFDATPDQIIHMETTWNKDKTVPNSKVLIIENLPQNINRELLRNFLMQFGEVISIALVPLRDRITARIMIDSKLERIIKYLNGSSPFGAGTQPLRCYQEGVS